MKYLKNDFCFKTCRVAVKLTPSHCFLTKVKGKARNHEALTEKPLLHVNKGVVFMFI